MESRFCNDGVTLHDTRIVAMGFLTKLLKAIFGGGKKGLKIGGKVSKRKDLLSRKKR